MIRSALLAAVLALAAPIRPSLSEPGLYATAHLQTRPIIGTDVRRHPAGTARGDNPITLVRAPEAAPPPRDSSAPAVPPGGALSWTVCASGCTYPTPLAAWNAARALTPRQTAPITIVVSHGAYAITDQFFTDCACDKWIVLLGDVASPASVTLNFTNIAGNNFSAFAATNGGRIGLVDGFTINGVGAKTGATAWASQSYGGAFSASNAAGITVGPHTNAGGFYYSLLADQGGRIVANGATFHDAGDANLLARFGGGIQCQGCTVSDAGHVFTDAHGNQTEVVPVLRTGG